MTFRESSEKQLRQTQGLFQQLVIKDQISMPERKKLQNVPVYVYVFLLMSS